MKPDQLIKRRGKLGLVGINLDLSGVREWLQSHLMRETTVSRLAAFLNSRTEFFHPRSVVAKLI